MTTEITKLLVGMTETRRRVLLFWVLTFLVLC